MQEFKVTLIMVGIMLAYAVPGFVLIKVKAVKPDSISAFSKLLMFVCQPVLTLYSFNKADYSKELLINLLIFFVIITIVQLVFIGIFYLIFCKKMEEVKYRIVTIATTLSNCSFLGVPLLEALFPDSPNVAVYSMMYFLSMSLLGWTLVSAIITCDKKYISIKKILLNPATISFVYVGYGYASCDRAIQKHIFQSLDLFFSSNQSIRFPLGSAGHTHAFARRRGAQMVYVRNVCLSRRVSRSKLRRDFGRRAGRSREYCAFGNYVVDNNVALNGFYYIGKRVYQHTIAILLEQLRSVTYV